MGEALGGTREVIQGAADTAGAAVGGAAGVAAGTATALQNLALSGVQSAAQVRQHYA